MNGGGSDNEEKSHAPTEKRLSDARLKGDIPLSPELTTAAAYIGFAIMALGFGGAALQNFGQVLSAYLRHADMTAVNITEGGGRVVLGTGLRQVTLMTLPWIALPAAIAVLALVAQQAPVFAPSKLQPKGSRISPLTNLKQKLGKQGLVEFAKSCAKLTVFGAVTGQYVLSNRDLLFSLSQYDPRQGMAQVCAIAGGVILRVAIVAAAFGIADVLWQRFSHSQRLRMSHKDLRDEHKESEGDPALKHQRRQRAVEIATKPLRKAMAEADVVIVNPTHYAVALAWDRQSVRPPHCVAKGTDEMAASIRALAVECGVPIHSDPPTARLLHATLDVGDVIDRAHFPAVAAAIRFADAIRKKAKR